MTAALDVRNLSKIFVSGGGPLGLFGRRLTHAVDDVSFSVARGATLCLVGESGCGKTTIGRMVVRLTRPTSGSIAIDGEDFSTLSGEALRRRRQRVQMVFQDPFASLNARMRAGDIVGEPMDNFGMGSAADRDRRARRLFDLVGLPQFMMERLPRELSGGQRQRLGIARALAAEPSLVIADEAVAALDVSIRSQILNLLADVQKETGVAYLFISHDLSVVRHIADEVAVMYLGVLVERAPAKQLFEVPVHPYTRALIAAIPAAHPSLRKRYGSLEGEVPSAASLPSGCRFRTRCPLATEVCATTRPVARWVAPAHFVACHHASVPGTDGIEAAGESGSAGLTPDLCSQREEFSK